MDQATSPVAESTCQVTLVGLWGYGATALEGRYTIALSWCLWPCRSVGEEHIYLSSFREQRGMLHTVLKVDYQKLHIINVHLGLDNEEREIQMRELVDFIKKLGDEPYVVVGNFNQGEVTVDNDILSDVAKELGKANILTFPTGLDRIDYIFVSSGIEVIDYDVFIKDMSDHYPIFARIKI